MPHIFDVNLFSLCLRLSACVYEKTMHLSSSILNMSHFEPFIPYLWEAEIHHLDRDQHIFNRIQNRVKIQSVICLKHFRHIHTHRISKVPTFILMGGTEKCFNDNRLQYFLSKFYSSNVDWLMSAEHLDYVKLMPGKQDSMPFASTHFYRWNLNKFNTFRKNVHFLLLSHCYLTSKKNQLYSKVSFLKMKIKMILNSE